MYPGARILAAAIAGERQLRIWGTLRNGHYLGALTGPMSNETPTVVRPTYPCVPPTCRGESGESGDLEVFYN